MNLAFDYSIRNVEQISRYTVTGMDYRKISFSCHNLLNENMINSINDWRSGQLLNDEVKALIEDVIKNNIIFEIGSKINVNVNEGNRAFIKKTISNNLGFNIDRVEITNAIRDIQDNGSSIRLLFSIYNTANQSINNREVYVGFTTKRFSPMGYIKEAL